MPSCIRKFEIATINDCFFRTKATVAAYLSANKLHFLDVNEGFEQVGVEGCCALGGHRVRDLGEAQVRFFEPAGEIVRSLNHHLRQKFEQFLPVCVHDIEVAELPDLARAVEHHVEFVKAEVFAFGCKGSLAGHQHADYPVVKFLFQVSIRTIIREKNQAQIPKNTAPGLRVRWSP